MGTIKMNSTMYALHVPLLVHLAALLLRLAPLALPPFPTSTTSRISAMMRVQPILPSSKMDSAPLAVLIVKLVLAYPQSVLLASLL